MSRGRAWHKSSTDEDQVYGRYAEGEASATEGPPLYLLVLRTEIADLPWRVAGLGDDLLAMLNGLRAEGYILRCRPAVWERVDGEREFYLTLGKPEYERGFDDGYREAWRELGRRREEVGAL